MAAKKKAKAKRRPLRPHDYVVSVDGTHVVIVGKNAGNIRARGAPTVSFSCDPKVPGFTITCTEFQFNDQPGNDTPAWPFEDLPLAGWLTTFKSKLIKPEKGATQLVFKYTIAVNVTDTTAADPVIIIDR